MKAKKTGLIIAIAASVAVIAGAVAAAVLFIKPASEPEPTAASDEVTQAADEQVHENIDGIDWYDPSGSEFVLTDADMLYDLQTLSYHYDFAGQTIKLGADIIVNRGDCAAWKENAPERSWSPIRGFAGTFDGCGHTISGLYANTQNEPLALFSGAETGAIIRDFRLENSLFINFGSVGTASIASASGGTYERIYSNVVLINEFGQAGGLFSRQKGRIVASECWFDGSITSGYRRIGGIADWADGDEMVLDHCLSTGSLTCTWPSAASHLGGLVGSVMNSARLVINDCFSGGRISVRNLYSTGSVLGYTDSASNATIINTFCTLEQCEFPVSLQAANVTGGPVPIVEKDLAGIGAYKWTDLDFENYWACAESSMPVLKCFAKAPLDTAGVEKAVAYDWYDDMKDEFVITTIPELYAFALMSYNTDYAGKTVKLAADLTLNEGDPHDWIKAAPELRWYPVNNFAGIFDGQSHSISGVYVFGENAQGFFGRTKGTAFIKNFSLKDSLIHSRGKSLLNTDLSLSGAIVGRGGGMLDGVYTNAVVYGEGSQIGGMFGQINLSGMITTINNCWFDGELIEPDPEIGYMAGGLIGGLALGTVNISHCLVSGTITTSVNKGSMAGGFVGLTMNDAILNISDSLFTGKLDTANPYYVGGTIGVVRGKNKVTINKCYARYGSMQDAQGEYVSLNISVASAQVSGGAAPVIERYLKGTKAYQWTELNFDRYWSVREDDYPVPSVFYRGDAVSTDGLERLVSTEWYDPEAESLTISSRKDFIGFIMLSYGTDFAGKTVELGSSIKLSSDPYNRTVQLMPIDNFAGTFDGHGRTISGLYQHGKNLMGLFRRTDKTAVVKNLRLTNSFIEVDGYGKNRLAYAGAISAQGGGTFRNIYTDAYILSHGYGTGGMFGRFNIEKTTNRLSSLWFDGMLEADDPEYGYVCGGLVAQLLLGKTEISHCLFSGTIKTAVANKGSKVGGLVGWAWNQSEAVVNDCLSAGKLVCNNNYYKGAVLGTLYAKNPFTIKNTFAESTVALDNSGKFISAATHADAVNGELSGQALPVIKERLIGINGYKWTTLDFDNYWTAREGACPAPKSLAGSGLSTASAERMIDTSWYSQDKKEYTIDSVKALMGFQMLSFADSFAGKTVKLGADINMNPGWTAGSKAPENGFTPIENFAGTFDGQGHTLSGVYVDGGSGTGVGLIKALRGGTVKDLKLTNSYIKGSGVDIAAVAGQSYGGTFERVYTDAVIETASSAGIGGILGTARGENTVTMRECQFDGRIKCTVEESGGRLGGLCATVVNSGTVLNAENCLVSGRIEANMNMTIGGITALSFQ
ncbi:MAG: hypothetical protein IJS22_04050, partial [Lachnospiraceae bacterium]|nr:hypothetical protein [Lachnospiraceae bacterium]